MLNRDQIAEIRREIEAIRELNSFYRARKNRSYQDQAEFEKRKMRLEQIKEQLLDCRRVGPGL